MAKTHNKTNKLGLSLGVMMRPTGTQPIDDRLVVDSVADLTNGSITAPYQGMVVNIAGTSDLWVLKTQGIAESKDINNWEKIGASDSINNLDYATDSDVDDIFDGSNEPGDGIVTIKRLSYYLNKVTNEVKTSGSELNDAVLDAVADALVVKTDGSEEIKSEIYENVEAIVDEKMKWNEEFPN